MDLTSLADIHEARSRILRHIHQTPVLTSRTLNEQLGLELFFKCENFQRVGAFKFRGAYNAILATPQKDLANGVATHSSGNHAQALSLAARISGIDATIVMPSDATLVKRRAVEGYGAKIILCEPTLESREQTLQSVIGSSGAHAVHPYDDNHVIAGQGTAAIELLEAIPSLDSIIAPVGGGGLLAGTAVAASTCVPPINVIGAEPAVADDAYRSLAVGKLIPIGGTTTIADGLRTSLGKRNFRLLQRHNVTISTVTEESIVRAMRLVWERMKIIIEPSAAVTLAAVMEKPHEIPGRRLGLIFSGGNVDLDKLPWQ